jgi:predicted aldo/keto reductase-like oxidoreductase
MIYENKKDNKFRFYEMKGYNERRYTFENVLKDINNLIQNQLLKKDTDKFINFIWYCFQKEKYNEEEQKNIEELKNNFNDEKQIKIFFISTKTKDKLSINEIFKKISNFKNNNSRKKLIEEEEKYIKFKVLAEPMEIINEKGKLIDIINPFGIDSLIKNTIEKFNDNNKEKKSDFISLYSQRNKRPLYLIKTIKNFS